MKINRPDHIESQIVGQFSVDTGDSDEFLVFLLVLDFLVGIIVGLESVRSIFVEDVLDDFDGIHVEDASGSHSANDASELSKIFVNIVSLLAE